MEDPMWQRILIDWVNCLKLSNPVQGLEDLKDGLFFSNLHRVIKKSSEIDRDILTCIFDVLNEHYSEYVIPNNTVIHLSDLSRKDLCAITSLLMHYTCIHDRRDVLTSPLCFNLQESTQIKIRNFLEKVQDCTKLNNAELASIVSSCLEDNRTQNWSSEFLINSFHSPLQDVLKTPATKSSRLFERDKEIGKLKAHLDLVQEEKENIEKEFKTQVERNKKLEKQLSQKTSEITNLRSEVLELENRTPPHYRDKDFREMQKILRTKVDSLEQILEQSDKENAELRDERDKATSQVKELESRCKTWFEKFIDADKNVQLLTEKYKEQQVTYENLRVHCIELEVLLEELKPKSVNESFIEESFQNSTRRSRIFETQTVENLGQSVVDVQLKEFQKENEVLKTDLDETRNICKQLKEEVNTLILEKSVVTEEKGQLENELQELNGKIEEFMLNYEQLHTDCSILTREKNSLLKQKNSVCNDNKNLRCSLSKLQNEMLILSEELVNCKRKRDESVAVQHELNEKLEETVHNRDKLKVDLENSISENCQLSERLKTLTNKQEHLYLEYTNLQSEKTALTENVGIKEALISELDTKNNNLLQQLEHLNKEKAIVLDNLSTTAEKVLQLEQTLQLTRAEKNAMEKNLQNISVRLDESSLLNSEYLQKLTSANTDQNALKDKIYNLNNEIDNLFKDCHQLTDTIKQTRNEKENILSELENQQKLISEISFQLKETENDKLKVSEELVLTSSHRDRLLIDLEKAQNNFNNATTDNLELLNKLNIVEEKFETLQSQLDNKSRDKDALMKTLEEVSNDRQELNEQYESFKLIFDQTISEKNLLDAKLKMVTDEKADILNQKNTLSNDIERVQKSLDKAKDEITALSAQLTQCKRDQEELVAVRNGLGEQLEDILRKNATLDANLEQTLSEKCELSEKLKKSICEYEHLELQYNNINLEKHALIEKMIAKELEIIELQTESKMLSDEVEKLKQEKLNIFDNLNATIEAKLQIEESLKTTTSEVRLVEKRVQDISLRLEQSSSLNAQYLEQLDTANSDRKALEIKLQRVNTDLEDYSIKCKELTDEIKKVTVDKNAFLAELQNKSKLILEMSSQRNETENEKLKMAEEIATVISDRDSLLTDLETLKKKLITASNENENMLKETETVMETLNKTIIDKEQFEEQCHSLKLIINRTVSEKNSLDEEINKLTIEKSDLQAQKVKLSDTVNNLQSSINEITNEAAALSEGLEACKKERNDLIVARTDLDKQLIELLCENVNLETNLEKIVSEKCQLFENFEYLTSKYENLEMGSKKLESDNLGLSEHVNTSKIYIADLESKNRKLLNQLEKLDEEKSNIYEQLKSTSETVSEIQESLDTTRNEKDSLEIDLNDITRRFQESSRLNVQYLETIAITNKFIETLEEKTNKLDSDIERSTVTFRQITNEKNDALTELENKSKQILEFSTLLDEARNDKLKISEELAQLNSSKEKLLVNVDKLQKDLQNTTNYSESLFQENKKLTGSLKETINEKHQSDEKYKSLLLNVDKHITEKGSLVEQLERLTQENNEYLKQAATLNNNIGSIQKSLNKVNEEVVAVSEKLAKSEKDRDELIIIQRGLEKRLEESLHIKIEYEHLMLDHKKLQLERQTLTENISSLTLENSQTSDKLGRVSKGLQSAVDDFARENKLLTEKLNKEADVLQRAILEKENVLASLKTVENEYTLQCKTLSENKTELEAALLQHKELVKHLQSDNVLLSEKLVNASNENIILKDKINNLEEESRTRSEYLAKIENEMQNCVLEKEDASKSLEESKLKISDLSTSLDGMRHEREHLIQDIKTAEGKLLAMDSQLETTTTEISKLSDQLNEYQSNKEQYLAEIGKLKNNLDSIVSSKNQIEDSLQKSLEEKTVISNFLDFNNNELQKVQQEKEDILEALEQSNKEIIVIQEEKEKLLKEIERLTQVKNEFSEQLDKVSQEKVDIIDKFENVLKTNYQNVEQVKDLQNSIKQFTEENNTLLGKITIVSNDLENKSKTVDVLQSSCNILKKEADEKSELLEKLSEEHKDIFEIVDRLSQEKVDMMQTISTLSEEKMLLTQRLNDRINHIEDLIQEKTKLLECLDLTNNELQKVKKDRNEILDIQTKIMKETQSNLLLAHQSAIEAKNDLMKRIETAESEKETLRKQVEQEIINLRKKIEDKNKKLGEYVQIKEAYDRLLEDNNKLMMEVDTIKYKRFKDRDDFVSLLKKERETATRESKRVKEVRNEYEGKLEKMKEKMLKLYREEVSKEMLKVKAEQTESICLLKTIEDLRNDLFETQQKIQMLETERDMLKIKELQTNKNMHTSKESLRYTMYPRDSIRGSLTSLQSVGINCKYGIEASQVVKKGRSTSVLQQTGYRDPERRTVTLPRSNLTEIQETVTISRRTSLNNVTNIEMEDEDDDFNNKYLTDLKDGHCVIGDNGRFSELAWRNSMLPPHLKSSYPAETQFVSPSKFKEDDLKAGNMELDDSLCKLLPGERRQKKDFGTTTYKKPGPPTPSKNGGRLSLQGNEVQPLPLREQNEKTPKKLTPSRIRALFMGKSSTKENSENQPATPRTKQRLSIFRKQR